MRKGYIHTVIAKCVLLGEEKVEDVVWIKSAKS